MGYSQHQFWPFMGKNDKAMDLGVAG